MANELDRRDFLDGHDLAKFVDILGQPLGDAAVGMEQLQILDEDSLALKAKDLAIPAIQPYAGQSQIQIPNGSLRPAVNVSRPLPTDMTDRVEPLIRQDFDPSLRAFGMNGLVDNSDSRKREIFCYTQCGHRRPPWDDFLACTQVYYPEEIPDVHSCLFS